MAEIVSGLIKGTKKFGVLGLGSLALGAAVVGLGAGTASAEITEVAPSPSVTSEQAVGTVEDAIRGNSPGIARGQGGTSASDIGVVRAQGEVRDSVKAVVGSKAEAFAFCAPDIITHADGCGF